MELLSKTEPLLLTEMELLNLTSASDTLTERNRDREEFRTTARSHYESLKNDMSPINVAFIDVDVVVDDDELSFDEVFDEQSDIGSSISDDCNDNNGSGLHLEDTYSVNFIDLDA